MSKRYAVVPHTGGTVSNIIVGDDLATVESIVGECVEMTEETGQAGPGYLWDGTTFTAPADPVTE